MGLKLTTGTPPALEEALARGVRDAQADDPLSPVGVLLGGTLQRPYLQRRLAELNDGIANVRFLMPSELAMELGEQAQVLAGNRPLPPLADRVLLREIAASREGDYFEPVRDTPGLADALHRLVRELRGAGYNAESLAKAVDGACEAPEKAQAIDEILAEFLRRVGQGPRAPSDSRIPEASVALTADVADGAIAHEAGETIAAFCLAVNLRYLRTSLNYSSFGLSGHPRILAGRPRSGLRPSSAAQISS